MPRLTSPLIVAALAWPAIRSAAEPAPAPTFDQKVVAVAAVDESLPTDRFDVGPLDGLHGTRIAVVLSLPDHSDHRVVGLDVTQSTLTRAHDNTHRDLLTPATPTPKPIAPALLGTPSTDARHLLIELGTPRSPAPAARTVSLAATLHVRLARGRQSLTLPDVVLQPGPIVLAPSSAPSPSSPASSPAATLTTHITTVTQEDWGQGVFTHATFRFQGPAAPRVSAIQLLSPTGDTLDGSLHATVRYRNRTDFTYAVRANTADRNAPVTLKISLWEELRVVPVELEITAPLGLGN